MEIEYNSRIIETEPKAVERCAKRRVMCFEEFEPLSAVLPKVRFERDRAAVEDHSCQMLAKLIQSVILCLVKGQF